MTYLLRLTSCAASCILVMVANGANAQGWMASTAATLAAQNEASALAVATKQTALSANVTSESKRTALQQLASAIGAVGASEKLLQAIVDFSPVTGQPITSLCVAQEQGKLHVEAVGQADRDRSRLMASFAANRVSSPGQADQDAIDIHRRQFCTVSEAKQGFCALAPTGMQGWDLDYSGAFSQLTLAPEAEVAGYAYIAMVADVRVSAQGDCRSAACNAAAAAQLTSSAAASMVANSLVGQVTDRRIPMLTGQ